MFVLVETVVLVSDELIIVEVMTGEVIEVSGDVCKFALVDIMVLVSDELMNMDAKAEVVDSSVVVASNNGQKVDLQSVSFVHSILSTGSPQFLHFLVVTPLASVFASQKHP